MTNGIAAFVLVGGKTHEEKAEAFLRALPRILRFLERNEAPFIARIYKDGKVRPWLDESTWKKRLGASTP